MSTTPLSVVTWKWGSLFGPQYVNKLMNMLVRHLHVPFQFYCVTDNPIGLDPGIMNVVLPETLRDTPRCIRRMRMYDKDWSRMVFSGDRIFAIDLDVVITDDITDLIIKRPEPVVGWWVPYASVFCGSLLMYDNGALHGLWQAFKADPEYVKKALPQRQGSDQDMINYWLKGAKFPITPWGKDAGIVTYFGAGYERFEHLGVGPKHPTPPPGTRIIVLGHADKLVMDDARYPWVREHWR